MPSGPCIICGETNYPLSFGGPAICPGCDCGVPLSQRKFQRELVAARERILVLEIELAENKSRQPNTKLKETSSI